MQDEYGDHNSGNNGVFQRRYVLPVATLIEVDDDEVLQDPDYIADTIRKVVAFSASHGNTGLVADPYVASLIAESIETPLPGLVQRSEPSVIPHHMPGILVRPVPIPDDGWPFQRWFNVCWRCQDMDAAPVERALRVAWIPNFRGQVVELAVCDNCAADLAHLDPYWMA